MKMECKYRLVSKENGFYDADSLLGLLFLVFSHRLEHWRKGDGWVD